MPKELDALAEQIIARNKRALSKAITLIESTRPDHRRDGDDLLSRLMPHTGNALRIGITGSPGVGKSTFIEAISGKFIKDGYRLAVLAVDPSSARSGGSILGDKTRMPMLAQNDAAFIRPSPAGKTLGGVARRSFETMLLCEAAGYDVVFVETVGVGQSETRVADMTDMFALLIAPGGGDELQGIKRGIMELADLIIINKADGAQEKLAQQTAGDYRNALKLLRPHRENWRTPVKTCSALKERGLSELSKLIWEFKEVRTRDDQLKNARSKQTVAWMWSQISDEFLKELQEEKKMTRDIKQIEKDVQGGRLPASTAANRLVQKFLQINSRGAKK